MDCRNRWKIRWVHFAKTAGCFLFANRSVELLPFASSPNSNLANCFAKQRADMNWPPQATLEGGHLHHRQTRQLDSIPTGPTAASQKPGVCVIDMFGMFGHMVGQARTFRQPVSKSGVLLTPAQIGVRQPPSAGGCLRHRQTIPIGFDPQNPQPATKPLRKNPVFASPPKSRISPIASRNTAAAGHRLPQATFEKQAICVTMSGQAAAIPLRPTRDPHTGATRLGRAGAVTDFVPQNTLARHRVPAVFEKRPFASEGVKKTCLHLNVLVLWG